MLGALALLLLGSSLAVAVAHRESGSLLHNIIIVIINILKLLYSPWLQGYA